MPKTINTSSRESQPLLSVVIPTLNSKQHYKSCIGSLLRMEYKNFEIIVVDDGSTDGSLEALKIISSTSPRIKVIKTLTRRGIPASRNLGIEFSEGEMIAFLDMDMKLGKGWPNEIIKLLLSRPDIGGIVPKVLDFQKRKIIQAVGIHIVPHTSWVIGRGLGETDKGQYNEDCEINIGAAGSIIRRQVLEDLGGFDETLGIFDDVDLGWRIRLLGWRTLYTPKAIMYHWTSKPWSERPKSSSMILYELYIDNLIRSLIKNFEAKNLLRYLPQYLIIMFIRVGINLMRGNTIPLYGSIRSIIWNISHLGETLKERHKIQEKRKVTDKSLFETTFVKGNFFTIYFKYLKPTLNIARSWSNLK